LAGERRIIVSGLEPADTVVVRGIQRVRPGSPVRIKTAPGQGAGAD